MRRRHETAVRRKYEPREREDDEDGAKDEGGALRVLPPLASAKKRVLALEKGPRNGGTKPPWMDATSTATRRKKEAARKDTRSLSLLDEQMLILCRSAMQRTWGEARSSPEKTRYGHESIYAATQVQRLFRGFKTRQRLAAANGPRFQRAASQIQFALRRVVVAKRVFGRWMAKRHRCATRIQAWYRGCSCRDALQYTRAQRVIYGITMFQRRFRGYRFWNLVTRLLAQRRKIAATQIQRYYRGVAARRYVHRLREESLQLARDLRQQADLHRYQGRCVGCRAEQRTESSLFACFMVRFVGLHDLAGAKTLGLEGLQDYQYSARFSFMYSVLLQAMGEDLEISMAFLRRAQHVLALSENDVLECERRYFFPALQLSKNDIAILLDLAIVSQCSDKSARAESFYQLALEQSPVDYSVPGYLHRVDMLDRLLLNYHRFCSVFNTRKVNVLAKVMPIVKRGEQVRVMVARLNHFVTIYVTEEESACRFNALYLSSDEVVNLLSTAQCVEEDEVELKPKTPSYRSLTSWKRTNTRSSTRKGSGMSVQGSEAVKQDDLAPATDNIVTQAYQTKFRGLHIKPKTLSALSESRSRLQITRDHAERLLRELVFLDLTPFENADGVDLQEARLRISAATLYRAVLVPSILKLRLARQRDVISSHAIVNIQRVFRGFRVRARIRRENLLKTIQQDQVDQLYAKLHQNFQIREKRRHAATAIQRIFKGFALRTLVRRWHVMATTIQRVLRGYRGRKRAIAFRDGNLTFFMAERVYQRGVSISGCNVILVIERCGLSFRLEAYDIAKCTMYPGFLTHDTIMALIRYENWSYGQRLVGRDVWIRGVHAVVSDVALIGQDHGQCVVKCRTDEASSDDHLISLVECVQAINLRGLASKGRDVMQLPLPLTLNDVGRIVAIIVQRLSLVPSIPFATKELQKKSPGSLILTLTPPPKVHYKFNKTGSSALQVSQTPAKMEARLSTALTHQIAFPVLDGYRGVSIGEPQYRKKCNRHAVHFTKCRCVLPLVATPAYLEALSRALIPPSSPSYTKHHPPPTF